MGETGTFIIWIIAFVAGASFVVWINVRMVFNGLKPEDLERYGIPVRRSTKKLWKWEQQGLENSADVRSKSKKAVTEYAITEESAEYYFMGLLARSSYVMEGTLVSKEIVFRDKSSALTWEKYEFEELRDISGRYMDNRLILHDPRNRQITPFEIGRRYILVVTKLQGEYAPDGSDLYQGSQIRCRLSVDRPEVIDFLEVAGCRTHFMGTRKEFIRRIEEVVGPTNHADYP